MPVGRERTDKLGRTTGGERTSLWEFLKCLAPERLQDVLRTDYIA